MVLEGKDVKLHLCHLSNVSSQSPMPVNSRQTDRHPFNSLSSRITFGKKGPERLNQSGF